MRDAIMMVRKYALVFSNVLANQECLRNAIRMQAVPETQKALKHGDFSNTVILPGMRLGDLLSLPCGPEVEWDGDRELTFSYIFKDEDDWQRVLGSTCMLGWQIPPLERSASGRKRTRRKGTAGGYLLPFFGKSNASIEYGIESGVMRLVVPLGYFNEQFVWWSGAELPLDISDVRSPLPFDIVTRQRSAVTQTEQRVKDHFQIE